MRVYDLAALSYSILRRPCEQYRSPASCVRAVIVTALTSTTRRRTFVMPEQSQFGETTLFTPRYRRPSSCRRHVEINQLPAAAAHCSAAAAAAVTQ